MIYLKILLCGFFAASLALAYLLLMASIAWSWAEFDCFDGYWACHRQVAGELALILIPALTVWGAAFWLLVREWNRL